MKDMSSSIGAVASKHSEALKHLNDENKALRTQVNSMKKEVAALKKQCESLSKQKIKQHSASEEEEVQDEEEEEAPLPPLSRQTKKNTTPVNGRRGDQEKTPLTLKKRKRRVTRTAEVVLALRKSMINWSQKGQI